MFPQTAPQCGSHKHPECYLLKFCCLSSVYWLLVNLRSPPKSIMLPPKTTMLPLKTTVLLPKTAVFLQLLCRSSSWLRKFFLHFCYEESSPILPSHLDPCDLTCYLASPPPGLLHLDCCLHVSASETLFWACLPLVCFSLTLIQGIAFFRNFLRKGASIKCAGPSLWLQLFSSLLAWCLWRLGWPLWSSSWPAFPPIRTTTGQ